MPNVTPYATPFLDEHSCFMSALTTSNGWRVELWSFEHDAQIRVYWRDLPCPWLDESLPFPAQKMDARTAANLSGRVLSIAQNLATHVNAAKLARFQTTPARLLDPGIRGGDALISLCIVGIAAERENASLHEVTEAIRRHVASAIGALPAEVLDTAKARIEIGEMEVPL